MLRKDLISSISHINKAFTEAKLDKLILTLVQSEKKVQTIEILNAYSIFLSFSRDFSDTEIQICNILGLEPWLTNDFWSIATDKESRSSSPNFIELYQDTLNSLQFLPRIIELLRRKSEVLIEAGKEVTDKKPTFSSLTVYVIEENFVSTPERLIYMLQSIQGFYDISAFFLNLNNADLSIIACDSGSDKSFDFLGAAKIIECVKEIILSFWDKVIYYREEKTANHLDLIAKSLPIYEKLSTMIDAGQIEPERAELLRRQIIESVGKFSKAGVTTPEIERNTFYNPRQLMQPEPKLLLPGEMVEKELEIIEKEKSPKASGKRSKKGKPKQKKALVDIDLSDPDFRVYILEKASEYKRNQG
jgi:hypothetical protein